MNWNEIEGHWTTLKGKAKEHFGDLTDNDLTEIDGKKDQLVGRIQRTYGITLEEAETRVNHFVDDVNNNKDRLLNLSADGEAALKGGGVAGAVVGAIAGSALGALGTIGGAIAGGAVGGAASAAAVEAVDKYDSDGSPDEKQPEPARPQVD
ncbi:MAG: CsbD family protein [Chthonomonas sp.]|nr:CsbD family protein [Chthonomonas sp.]